MLTPERIDELQRELALRVLAGDHNVVSVMFAGDGSRTGVVLDIIGQCISLISKVIGARALKCNAGGEPLRVSEAAAADVCRDLMAVGFRVKSLDHGMLPDGVEEEMTYP